MRILVAGGGGFIGRHLVAAMVRGGHQVTVFDRSSRPGAIDASVCWTVHDFVAGPIAAHVASSADVVFCLVGAYRGTDNELLAANVAALNSCLSSLAFVPGLVVYVGAGSVYGESETPVTEERPPAPSTSYGLTKWLAELVLRYHSARQGFPFVVLRPTNVYGPGNRKNVFFAFYDSYRQRGSVTIHGDGLQGRDFVYIDDFVDLLQRVADPARRRAVRNEVFNVAGAVTHTLADVLKEMSLVLGLDIPASYQPSEPGALVNFRMSIAKAERLVAWKPQISLSDGVRATIASYAAE